MREREKKKGGKAIKNPKKFLQTLLQVCSLCSLSKGFSVLFIFFRHFSRQPSPRGFWVNSVAWILASSVQRELGTQNVNVHFLSIFFFFFFFLKFPSNQTVERVLEAVLARPCYITAVLHLEFSSILWTFLFLHVLNPYSENLST